MKAHRIVASGIVCAFAAATVALACTGLQDFSLDTCGNSIIETNEQCDTVPIEGFTCFGKDAGARACHVACGEAGACPSGWACGTDEVCRKPSGFFATTATIDDVGTLVIGDFDGDGRKDVLTRGTGIVRVHYFDTLGAQIATTELSVPRGRVVSGDLTGDAGSSVVVFDSDKPANGTVGGTGLDVFRGASNRTLSAVLFQSTPIPGTTDARTFAAHVITQSPHPGADDIVVYTEATQGPIGILAYFAEGGQFIPMAIVGHTPGAAIVNDIPVGSVPPATCDSAVLGYKGSTTVTIVRTCASATSANYLALDGGPGAFPPTTFDFLDPIAGPLFLYDTDKDGHLDIVTTAGSQPEGTIGILKGDGNGGFVASRAPGPSKGTVWAIGDIDGDGKTDGIDDNGLLLSVSSARYPTLEPVSYAQIRDINHDGFPDGIAMTANGIDVWLGTGTGSPNHRYYNIPNTKFITLGDADGDSNLDILVASDPVGATLSVLWGTPGGYPNEPLAMGVVGTTQHLSSGKFTWFFGEPSDSLAAFVDMTVTGPNAISVVPIRGRADRQLTAPFVLSTGSTLSDRSNPLAGTMSAVPNDAGVLVPSMSMLAGKASPKQPDDAAVPLTFWTAHSTPASVLDPNDLVKPPTDDAGTLLVTMPASATNANLLGVAAVDLDPAKNDGDELVVVIPGEQLAIAKLTSGAWQLQPGQPFNGGAPSGKPVKVLPGDFDGDGLRDVLVVFAGPDPDAGQVLGATAYFNDGQGHLGSPVILTMADALAVTTIHTLPNALTQVAAVGPSGLWIFNGPKLLKFPAGSTQSFPNAIDLAAGDINGDGLEDLVVATSSNFQVLLGTVSP